MVSLPSSSTINIYRGNRALDLGGLTENQGPLTPDWSSGLPYDWTGMIAFILSSPIDTDKR
jgi:hypothetical protein